MNTRDAAHKAQERTPPMASTPPDLERLIEVLERELDAARSREQAALEREQVALEREMLQLRLFEKVQKQFEQSTQQRHPALLPNATFEMRHRILALLEEKPEGLGRVAIQEALSVNKHLGDTLIAMARPGGLLIRKGKGIYALAPRDTAVSAEKKLRCAPE